MDIIVHSLYSHKDVFLRELVSNASDAFNKLSFLSISFLSMTDPSLVGSESELAIRLRTIAEEKILIIEDSGIGMTKEELINSLGTIAQSGTACKICWEAMCIPLRHRQRSLFYPVPPLSCRLHLIGPSPTPYPSGDGLIQPEALLIPSLFPLLPGSPTGKSMRTIPFPNLGFPECSNELQLDLVFVRGLSQGNLAVQNEALVNSKYDLQRMEDQQRLLDEDDQVLMHKWQKKTYCAVYRVLSKVSRRLPYFKPHHVFDYGAGPGTSMWAVFEAWPNTIELANLIEPSEAMSFARRRLFQAMKSSLPEIRNFNSMESFVRQVRPADREHNLVIATYSLGELKSAGERISVARQLWGLTTDVLVIVEPGTPRGSNIVREIRSHILCMENKRLWKHQKKNKMVVKEDTLMASIPGAFVVAPCPHDGVCPLDGTDKYCHFSQRLERSSSQLLVKRPKGKSLRGYEDEKFSFVVLRRGTRPRSDWPLDRVDPKDFELKKMKGMPHGYDVIIEEPMKSDNSEDEDQPDEENNWPMKFQKRIINTDTETSTETETEIEETADATETDSEGATDETTTDTECSEDDLSMQRDDASESGEDCLDMDRDEEAKDEDKGLDNAVADLGGGWGRILFTPIRRGKRVVVDLCCSANKAGTRGMFDRQTLTSTTNKILHCQARHSRWGDLWPCGKIK